MTFRFEGGVSFHQIIIWAHFSGKWLKVSKFVPISQGLVTSCDCWLAPDFTEDIFPLGETSSSAQYSKLFEAQILLSLSSLHNFQQKYKKCFRSKNPVRMRWWSSLTIILTNPIINHITMRSEERGGKWIFVFPASLFSSMLLNSPFHPEGQPSHRTDQSHPSWATVQLQLTDHKGHGIKVAIISSIIAKFWIYFPDTEHGRPTCITNRRP